MVAGTPTRTTFDKANVGHTAFEVRCLGANGQTLSTEWPMTNCPNGQRALRLLVSHAAQVCEPK